jgi:autotransporter family porin
MSDRKTFRAQLFLGTALIGSLAAGYARRAQAAPGCTLSGTTFYCYGATTTPVTITQSGQITVVTKPAFPPPPPQPFNITTSGTALLLTSTGSGVSFTDTYASTSITGGANNTAGNGIYGVVGPGAGKLSITTTGTVQGSQFGIRAYAETGNTGGIQISSTGTVSVVSNPGSFANSAIFARNAGSGDVTVTAGDVNAPSTARAILAQQFGVGKLTITTNGTATGSIQASNSTPSLGDLTLNLSTVTATNQDAVTATNYGSGVLSITSSGAVTTTVGSGIVAAGKVNSTGVTVHALGGATGDQYGINASNTAHGALSVTAGGTVHGGGTGIQAYNSAAGGSLAVNAADVTGGVNGVIARNLGTGPTTVSISRPPNFPTRRI